MSIWRFHDRLPEIAPEHRLTLGEGDTPLVKSRSIGPSLGLENLFFKIESCNPSGSFKDRFAAVAVSHLLSRGTSLCLGTSSGNTGAALAAYCAAAGLRCVLLIVDTAPLGKLTQMLAHNAELYRIRGFGTDAATTEDVFAGLVELARQYETAVQISAFRYSPIGMAGVRTIAWELRKQLAGQVHHVFTPSGGGGLTLATASELSGCCVHAVQPEGNNTIAGPLRDGLPTAQDYSCTTQISGLQVASVIDGHDALAACRRSGGTGWLVSDQATYAMQARLAAEEGIFCEPAGAVSVAGMANAAVEGQIKKRDVVVCLVTGSGFKDPSSVESMVADRTAPLLESFTEFLDQLA